MANLMKKICLRPVAEVAVEPVAVVAPVQVRVQVLVELMLCDPGIVVEGLRSI